MEALGHLGKCWLGVEQGIWGGLDVDFWTLAEQGGGGLFEEYEGQEQEPDGWLCSRLAAWGGLCVDLGMLAKMGGCEGGLGILQWGAGGLDQFLLLRQLHVRRLLPLLGAWRILLQRFLTAGTRVAAVMICDTLLTCLVFL